MTVETDSDRLEMLADFGVDATYTPDGGSASTVHGIFDNQWQGTDVGADVDVSTQLPRFLVREVDFPNVQEGDALTVGGVDYIIQVPMPDGTGMVELALEEVE